MSRDIVTVRDGAPLDDVVATMERRQIQRIPSVPRTGTSPASLRRHIAREAGAHEAAELVRAVSQESGSRGSR
jgi:hypothetical protein